MGCDAAKVANVRPKVMGKIKVMIRSFVHWSYTLPGFPVGQNRYRAPGLQLERQGKRPDQHTTVIFREARDRTE